MRRGEMLKGGQQLKNMEGNKLNIKNVVEFESFNGDKVISISTDQESKSNLYITVMEGSAVSTFDLSIFDLDKMVYAGEMLLSWNDKDDVVKSFRHTDNEEVFHEEQ